MNKINNKVFEKNKSYSAIEFFKIEYGVIFRVTSFKNESKRGLNLS